MLKKLQLVLLILFRSSIGELHQDHFDRRFGTTEPTMTESTLVTKNITSAVQCVLACAVKNDCEGISYDSENGQCRTSSQAFLEGEGGQLQSSLQFYGLSAEADPEFITKISNATQATDILSTTDPAFIMKITNTTQATDNFSTKDPTFITKITNTTQATDNLSTKDPAFITKITNTTQATDNFSTKGFADCYDVGFNHSSGVFTVTPVTETTFDVYCDMETPGGPWTVIQNRYDGSVDFMRSWAEYKEGFGYLHGEFWLGMEPIRNLLELGQALRITLESWQGDVKYADYTTFDIGTEAEKYKLTLIYSGGTLNDVMWYHTGMAFSTFDRDNDDYELSCSNLYKGGWWYHLCHYSNLNGLYVEDTGKNYAAAMTWSYFYADRMHSPLRKSKIMVTRLT